jgi:PAS domain S-box-containing protein
VSRADVSRLAEARVLVIEDNEELAENLIEILEDEGAHVRVASTAAAARALLDDGLDVALLDVQLPDSSGLALLPDLRQAGDGLAEVVLISGYATVKDAIEAVSGGVYAYILKPFRIEDLVAAVERAWRQVRSSRAERALATELRLREASLRVLVETVQALLLVLDQQGRVVQANPAVTSLTGVPVAELIGRAWIDEFVPEAERPSVRAGFQRLLAGEEHLSHEHHVLAPHQEQPERTVSWRYTPVRDKGGDILVYASGLDVTELKELEQRTRLAQRLAAVGTLSAGLAHEIRNPLNSAQLQLRLLERRLAKVSDDEKLHEPLHVVQQEIARLSGLVQEFLSFARPSVLDILPTDLTALARRVVELQGPEASERGVEIVLDAPAPVVIDADPGKIQQVLLNLVRNAVDAATETPGQRRVWVEVSHHGNSASVTVRDTGPGMTDEIKARMFEPFFSTKSEGTGLGMAICHSLVTQHGGDIVVRSELGHGAELEIVLPRQAVSNITQGIRLKH